MLKMNLKNKKKSILRYFSYLSILALVILANSTALRADTATISHEHPRLLGSIERLRKLHDERKPDYWRMKDVISNPSAGDYEKIISLALVSSIESDSTLGRQAIDLALTYVNGPIKQGHVTFGRDLTLCAIVYDLCWPYWTQPERDAYISYFNTTVDANVNSETTTFHNGWYAYKNYGIGIGCYATWYENDRAESILENLKKDYLERVVPSLELAGNGGGWAEGYYVNYWTYEWMFFCEVARLCEGWDVYATAPSFYRNRAVASMFEAYPWMSDFDSRRPIPMGDSGGRKFGGDRDEALSARRILVSRFSDDPASQVVHTFNEQTTKSGAGVYAYKDFLWRDREVAKGDLDNFKLSHYSPGPGYVYARSSWQEDATYFFFKCGDRFTSHQHLDNGHFLIAKYNELAGDGGHYDSFGSRHDVNYHLRTIAHSTVLVHDPDEIWPGIRAGNVTNNDGGQHHNWPHHNGDVRDAAAWRADSALYDIADITAYEDNGSYVYVAGDCSKAYDQSKLDTFTRQIVYLRPDNFVIFDRVYKTHSYDSTIWQLQAMSVPSVDSTGLEIINGEGRLYVRTLMPTGYDLRLATSDSLYSNDGKTYLPAKDTGPAPECRVQVIAPEPAIDVYFLHVLAATGSSDTYKPSTKLEEDEHGVTVTVDDTKIRFGKDTVSMVLDDGSVDKEGDFDGDGNTSIYDLLEMMKAISGRRTTSDSELTRGDTNHDGRLNIQDIIYLLINIRNWT